MSGRTVDVAALNVGQRLALTAENELGDIRVFLDEEGDETQDESVAVVAIVEWRGGDFSPVVIADFEKKAGN